MVDWLVWDFCNRALWKMKSLLPDRGEHGCGEGHGKHNRGRGIFRDLGQDQHRGRRGLRGGCQARFWEWTNCRRKRMLCSVCNHLMFFSKTVFGLSNQGAVHFQTKNSNCESDAYRLSLARKSMYIWCLNQFQKSFNLFKMHSNVNQRSHVTCMTIKLFKSHIFVDSTQTSISWQFGSILYTAISVKSPYLTSSS